ncbi:hypothetical protein [Hydrogenovibrio halophilus]|uniref:hypothetical protein n=1 Tax=Hydrogenovibrio halophilus TaxID=373391 RepID=UPI003898E9EF
MKTETVYQLEKQIQAHQMRWLISDYMGYLQSGRIVTMVIWPRTASKHCAGCIWKNWKGI